MKRALCVAPDCIGGHGASCEDDYCKGCGPRQAADGKWLCGWHRDRITEWPLEASTLYADLARMLTTTGVPGEKVAGSVDRGLSINEAAVEARTTIRHTLVGWVRIIHEERGMALPGRYQPEELPYGFIGPPRRVWAVNDTVPAMARYLVKHADWLASHGAAGDYAEEMRDLARGDARRVAFPSGARKFQVKTPSGQPVRCPQVVQDDTGDDQACPGHLWTILRRVDALLPSQLACDHDETHAIPASEWIRMGKRLMRHAGTEEGAA